jgi:hypothetical protein
MRTPCIAARSIIAAAFVTVAWLGPAAAEEKLVGTYGEERAVLAFKVPEATMQKLLPEGWESVPVASGPSQGSNLNVVFVDWITVTNPDGKPGETAKVAAITGPARKKGTEAVVPMVISGLVSVPSYAPGPYGVFAPAKVTIDRHTRTDAAGATAADEAWEYIGDGGDKIQLQLKYTRGVLVRGKTETKVYSAAKPEFYRIYRVEQAADVVRSTATNIDRAQTATFTASGPKLSPIFDGKEQLVSITSLPWYSRQVTLPELASK